MLSERPGRGHWGSRLGFILAAAGSAVGLGNVWKFPYVTGENGGGLFVVLYLLSIALIGIPVMIAEILIGRRAQRSPVGAFQRLAHEGTTWRVVGWMGVVAGFIILSYYSVVGGWTLSYALMSINRFFAGKTPEQIEGAFVALYQATDINIFWHFVFMVTTVGIVFGGIQKGIEAWSRVLMPALLVMLLVLLVDACFQPGFGEAVAFVFSPRADRLNPAGVLEALGQSFFTLSLGMGAMLTYGSYLEKDHDIVGSSIVIAVLDTLVALTACLVLFPIIFSFNMPRAAGPGLVFQSMPIAFSQMVGGTVLSLIFFLLLFFAALSSAISLLEVVVSTIIDQLRWSRERTVLLTGTLIFLFGIPSAIAGSGSLFGEWANIFGKNFFDSADYLASNWLLPLGGLFIAIFVGWVIPREVREEEFKRGSRLARLFPVWNFALRWLVPVAILLLWLFSVELLPEEWLLR